MASTNKTTNYELSQFIATDKPTFLGDYNGDMQKIDTAIAGVAATASGASSTATSALTEAQSASSTAASAATTAATADTNATSALTTAGNAATAASAAQSTADSAASAASAADAKAVAADAKAGDLSQLTTTAKANLVAAINEVNAKPAGGGTAEDITYDNTDSGLTATNVQAAIDELKALIPSTPEYVTTGLTIHQSSVVINDGGYYIDSNNIVHIDITVTLLIARAATSAMLLGFPEPNAATSGAVTPVFNNAYIGYAVGGDTSMNVSNAANVGDTIHFIGSYQLKTA